MLLPAEWPIVLGRYLGDGSGADIEVHLFGAPGQQYGVESIRKHIQEKFVSAAVINQAGRTSLQETLRLLTTAEVLIAIDSALLHCARLLGIWTISYWGPTSPDILLRPGVAGRDIAHYEKLSCSQCVHLAHRPPCIELARSEQCPLQFIDSAVISVNPGIDR
jgi:ADP-heptose:LPS heptosyltransferase